MPIYSFRCESGHSVSIVFKSISNLQVIDCPGYKDETIGLDELFESQDIWMYSCSKKAERVWSLPAKSAPIDDGKGLVYFENAKGHVEFSSIADKDKWQPEGYVKKEARNLHEREMLETKLRRQDDSRLAEQFEKRDTQRHYSEQVRHSDIRNMINQGAVDEKSAALLKKGMERTRNRTRKRPKSELRLAVNHESSGTLKNRK